MIKLPPIDRENILNITLYLGIHTIVKRKIEEKLTDYIRDFFRRRYFFQSSKEFKPVWSRIAMPHLDFSKPIASTLRKIDRCLKYQLIYYGKGIPQPANPLDDTHRIPHQFVQHLLHGTAFSSGLLKFRSFKAVFIKKDKELLKDFLKELQNELTHLADFIPRNHGELILCEAFLGNLLAYLPFCYPESGSVLQIPKIENEKWKFNSYTITVMDLNIDGAPTPMKALGLTSDNAQPILIYSGTTYPAGDGFTATLLADFSPGHAVGGKIFHDEKDKISEWFQGKENVRLAGTSLGGALCFHTLQHFKDKIGRVDVYNPPGLYPHSWEDRIDDVEVNIYCQDGDIVCKLGAWPEGNKITVYDIIPLQEGLEANLFSSHAKIFTGCEKIAITAHSPGEDNKKISRLFLANIHHYLGPLAIFAPLTGALYVRRLLTFRKINNAAIPQSHDSQNHEHTST